MDNRKLIRVYQDADVRIEIYINDTQLDKQHRNLAARAIGKVKRGATHATTKLGAGAFEFQVSK